MQTMDAIHIENLTLIKEIRNITKEGNINNIHNRERSLRKARISYFSLKVKIKSIFKC